MRTFAPGKTFDVLGWFSLSIIKAKILLRLWEMKIDWDDSVPGTIQDAWLHWQSELHLDPLREAYTSLLL